MQIKKLSLRWDSNLHSLGLESFKQLHNMIQKKTAENVLTLYIISYVNQQHPRVLLMAKHSQTKPTYKGSNYSYNKTVKISWIRSLTTSSTRHETGRLRSLLFYLPNESFTPLLTTVQHLLPVSVFENLQMSLVACHFIN